MPALRPAVLALAAALAAPGAASAQGARPAGEPLDLTPPAEGAKPAPMPRPPSATSPGRPGMGATTSTRPAAGTAAARPSGEADTVAVERASAWLSSTEALVANFAQVGPDGRRTTGKLYVLKPGRMRFAYDPPARIEVIADGSQVAVRDRKLATQDLYPVGQTPLKFLLKERVDLRRDVRLRGVDRNGELVTIDVEDRSTLGGTTKLALMFDAQSYALRQWTVTDPQGYETSVALSGLETGRRPDASLFRIDAMRVLEDRK